MAGRKHQLPKAAIRVVRFYKMDHLGDPALLPGGRIRLGVHGCMSRLRAGIKRADLDRRDNLVIAIGGATARDGLGDCLAWAGVPFLRQPDGAIDCENGFLLLDGGPLTWRVEFPLLARFIDRVKRGHRVGHLHRLPGERAGSIAPALCREFIRLYEWGRATEASRPRRRNRSGSCRASGRKPGAGRDQTTCGTPRRRKSSVMPVPTSGCARPPR